MNLAARFYKSTIYLVPTLVLVCTSFSSLALADDGPDNNNECIVLAVTVDENKNASIIGHDGGRTESCRQSEVSTPAATWLFGCALMGFVGLSNKKRA